MLSDTISNFYFFAGHYDFWRYLKNTIVFALFHGWGICTLLWGATLAGFLYKWMAPPCNLQLSEEKIKMPDKCLREIACLKLTEPLIKLSFTSIILSPLRIAHPCTSSKTQSPWSTGTNPLLNSSTTGSTADLVTIPPLVSQDPQGYNKNKA